MRQLLIRLTPVFDILLSPFVFLSCALFKIVRRLGVHRLTLCRHLFYKLGIFPVQDHYYEPLFNPKHLRHSLRKPRELPGVNLNPTAQLSVLSGFHFQSELLAIPVEKGEGFYYHNGAFESGDAEFLYNMIRSFKPKRLFEIGSGHSTRIARLAILKNESENPSHACQHVCVEPYEEPWLEQLGIKIVRKKAEELGVSFFGELEANDILFIDSSHMIRPQGDVLFEFLELLPKLKEGVLVHVHDIFTPHDYPDDWILEQVKFYNEQYLLEAFLTHNNQFEVVGALNYLAHFHRDKLGEKCPVYGRESATREPGSFWLRRVKAP